MEDNVNAFDSEEDINNEEMKEFEIIKIIKYFQQIKLIKQYIQCQICLSNMQLVKNEQYIDKYCWRSKSNTPKHDN